MRRGWCSWISKRAPPKQFTNSLMKNRNKLINSRKVARKRKQVSSQLRAWPTWNCYTKKSWWELAMTFRIFKCICTMMQLPVNHLIKYSWTRQCLDTATQTTWTKYTRVKCKVSARASRVTSSWTIITAPSSWRQWGRVWFKRTSKHLVCSSWSRRAHNSTSVPTRCSSHRQHSRMSIQ